LTVTEQLALAMNACKAAEVAILKDCEFFCGLEEGCNSDSCDSAEALKQIRELRMSS
jgi:hypothetical protein